MDTPGNGNLMEITPLIIKDVHPDMPLKKMHENYAKSHIYRTIYFIFIF